MMNKKFAVIRIPILNKWLLSPSLIALFFFLGLMVSCVSEKTKEANSLHPLMGNGYGINSATLVVENLDSTLKYYKEVLGFEMPPNEKIEKGFLEGTLSAALPFADVSYFKLLSVEDSVIATSNNSFVRDFLKQHEGVRLYSLSSSSLDNTYAWLTDQGFKTDSVKSYNKLNSFPQEGAWTDANIQMLRLGFDSISPPAYLPEFEESTVFPYERMHEFESFYNMQRGFLKHPNGVVGIAALQIVVEDLKAARKEFQKMGLSELAGDKSKNLARFKLKRNQELHIRAPQSPDDELAEFLAARGSGVFAITFEVNNLQATYDFLKGNLPEEALILDSLSNHLTVLKAYAHGVQFEFKEEPAEQALMAQQLNLNFGSTLDSAAQKHAEGLYIKYCALCHGENREGYAADFAPSLRSHSLLGTSKFSNFLRYTIQYGRANTAMAGYYDEQGGPLSFIEIELLLKWLEESSGVEAPIEISRDPVIGDIALGSKIYAEKCTTCHGANGEGITAPALANPMLLATATDGFLRYAISEGRDSTLMPAFKDSLSDIEIDAVTAFLRSRASGWDVPPGDSVTVPSPEDYVLNPNHEGPNFELREGLYVSAEQLNQALKDSARLVLLDARSTVAWRQTHIPGSIPVPYYEEPEAFVEDIPNDSTWIVAYCACPHAASGQVINKLKKYGFKNTAILDEGILVWAQLGYPVRNGQ